MANPLSKLLGRGRARAGTTPTRYRDRSNLEVVLHWALAQEQAELAYPIAYVEFLRGCLELGTAYGMSAIFLAGGRARVRNLLPSLPVEPPPRGEPPIRFFNTEGPVRADLHYCLPPLQRWDLGVVLRLIEQQKYFLLHAPRQTGKTSCLLALMRRLDDEGRYRAVYANLETAQTAREDADLQCHRTLGRALSR